MDIAFFSSIALFVAEKVSDEVIRKGLDKSYDSLTKNSFKKRLYRVIDKTLIEYDRINKVKDSNGKYAFFKSQLIIDILVQYSFFKPFKKDELINKINQDEKTFTPSIQELDNFLIIFERNLSEEKLIKKLEIEESYKERIFDILEKVENIERIIEPFGRSIDIKSKFINQVPYFNPGDLFGREIQLPEIHQKLQNSPNLLLLSGLGGIGKTALALSYANTTEFQEYYTSIIWITVTSGIKISFIKQLKTLDCCKGFTTEDSIDDQFDQILNYLQRMEGKNLLVIDNVNDINELLVLTNEISILRWNTIIITRTNFEGYPTIRLNKLEFEPLKKLFCRYYKKEVTDDSLVKLFTTLEFHTLLIELIAKTGNNYYKLSLDNLNEIITKEGLSSTKLLININIGNEYKRLFEHIYSIFQLEELSDIEKKFLSLFSIFPPQIIDLSSLHELYYIKPSEELVFINAINSLALKGWITLENQYLRCHSLIQTVIREAITFNSDVIEKYIITLRDKLYVTNYDNPFDKLEYLDHGKYALKYLNSDTKEIDSIANNIGTLLMHKGDLSGAQEYIDIAYKIRSGSKYSLSWRFAQANYNKGCLEIRKNNTYEAIDYFNKSIAIYLLLGNKYYDDIAQNYDALSEVYETNGNYELSLNYAKKALEIKLKCLPTNHPLLAISYNNISTSYLSLKKFPEALVYAEKDLEIMEIVYSENHPEKAISYDNISKIYLELFQYEKALFYAMKGLNMRKEIYKTPHNDLGKSFNSVGTVLNRMKKYPQSLEHKLKAFEIFSKIEPPDFYFLMTICFNISVTYSNLKDLKNCKKFLGMAIKNGKHPSIYPLVKDTDRFTEMLKIYQSLNRLK